MSPGDVLVTRSGPVGRSAVATTVLDGTLMTFHLLRVRTNSEGCRPEFVQFAIEGCPSVARQLLDSSVGATRAGLNTRLLRDLWMPLPPPSEQDAILEILNEYRGICTRTTSEQRSLAESINRLDASILAKAFRGELVPQDPNDDAASVLLERIRSEREKAGAKPKRGRAKEEDGAEEGGSVGGGGLWPPASTQIHPILRNSPVLGRRARGSAMRIDKLRLQNFRGFQDFELELHPEVTLLVGRNASGKTGVLEGLAVALGAWLSAFASYKPGERPIAKRDAHLLRNDELGTLEPQYPVRVEAKGTTSAGGASWARELRTASGRTTSGEAKGLRDLAADAEARLSDSNAPVSLPLVSYYTAGRLWVAKNEAPSRDRSRLQGYTAALELASDPKRFESWMKQAEQSHLQQVQRAADKGEGFGEVRSPQLAAVQHAACGCLEGATRLEYDVGHDELRVEFGGGPELPFDRLSDGQRSLVAMAADIAWRCVQLNPHLGEHAPAETSGVVLIDEIEFHLHPAWQRRVIGDLRHAFPKIQFVATTHSPQVLSSAERDWVRILRLDSSEVGRVRYVKGRDSNSILADLMGVPPRPIAAQRAIDEIEKLIEPDEVTQRELKLARTKLTVLQEQMGESDPTLLGLDWEIRSLEPGDAEDQEAE